MPHHDAIQPTTAPRSTRGRPKLRPHVVKHLAQLIVLGRKGSLPPHEWCRLSSLLPPDQRDWVEHQNPCRHPLRSWMRKSHKGRFHDRYQESALSSFKKEVLPLSHGGVNQWERVHHKRLEALARCKTSIERFLERNGLHPMSLEQGIVGPNTFFEQPGEAFGMMRSPRRIP